MKNNAIEHIYSIHTVYETLYKTFLLLASNLNRIWNILQIKLGDHAYLFGTNLYRLVFTCFNFRSVRTVPKTKPSVSCTRFFFIHMCLLKAAPLTQTQAQFNEISHLLRVGLPLLPWGDVICIPEVIDFSPGNLDTSLCFIQPGILHDVVCV